MEQAASDDTLTAPAPMVMSNFDRLRVLFLCLQKIGIDCGNRAIGEASYFSAAAAWATTGLEFLTVLLTYLCTTPGCQHSTHTWHLTRSS